jgi:hypothetical protein
MKTLNNFRMRGGALTHCGLAMDQRGMAIAEFLIAMLAMGVLVLGTIQFILVFNAKNIVNYATFEAAREGAVQHGRKGPMKSTFTRNILSLYGGGHTIKEIGKAYIKAKTDFASMTKVKIYSPSKQAFDDFGVTIKKQKQIPNEHLIHKSHARGKKSGVSLQDANLLKIEITYGYKLYIPIVNKVISSIMPIFDAKHAAYYLMDPPRMPIVAQATVRMQSNPYPDGNESVPAKK